MNPVDIVLILPLLWAIYAGFKEGVVVQVLGIAGLLLGVWLAFRIGKQAGLWLGMEAATASIAGFVVVLVAVVIIVFLLGRLLRGFCRMAGIGFLDRLGGVIFSFVKAAFVLSILLTGFDALNDRTEWVERKTLEESLLYNPLLSVHSIVFPYLDAAWQEIKPQTQENARI